MQRVLLALMGTGLSLAPLIAGAQDPGARSAPPATSGSVRMEERCAEPQTQPGADWRLQTYQHLDCLIGIVEDALESSSGETVTISRQDAQRIRTLAWWTKDAAARIGR